MIHKGWLALVVLALASSTAVADKASPDDIITGRLAALREAAKCSDKASPWRPWCIAADFTKGTAGELPKGKVLAGMTIELETGKDAKDALSKSVTFVALAVDADGKVKLTDVKPTSEEETKAVTEAVFNLANLFKGKARTAKLPADLVSYLKGRKGAYATTKSGNEWTWTGASPSKLRKVGTFWVAIEMPAKGNGIFATILTDAWE
jgi:hypothetical protein